MSSHPGEMRFTIYVDPVPKGRPRFRVIGSGRGKRVLTITPKRTLEFENDIREAFVGYWGADKTYPLFSRDVLLEVEIDFVFKRPKNKCTQKSPEGYIWREARPDLDNLQKSILDALNDIVWSDDDQIVKLSSRKMLSDKPPKKGSEALSGRKEEAKIALYVKPVPRFPEQKLCADFYSDVDFKISNTKEEDDEPEG